MPRSDGRKQFFTVGKLVEQLGLKDKAKTIGSVKNAIQESMETLFDPSIPLSDHDPSLIAELRGKLSQMFPEVFEHLDLNATERRRRMDAAIQYGRNYFYKNLRPGRVENEINAVDMAPKVPCKKTTVIEVIDLTQEEEDDDTLPNQRGPVTRSFAAQGSAKNANKRPSRQLPSSIFSISSVSSTGTLVAIKTESPPIKLPLSTHASNAPRKLPDCRTTEVVKFLESCDPNMRFLLDSFIAFGCRNRGFLECVAKRDEKEIEDFVKNVTRHHPPAWLACDELPEMEAWVLKKHFKKYFNLQHEGEENK